ncbi:glycosyltransferase family 1 protein [Mucilaginibacter roseus]|uniref:Glycosyltransferase family 1 protein n=1 Tax=Mucilaginibacter roseus TaxID=1528868 RepID=A0ABS8TZY9_9SPHI|nr:glycosyltransferase family 1 protein [Mucilaginibacter roseus]MCD8740411.1 glycosyltransferase family 1 protein [Mucilaginibacter roseus]
MPIVLGMIYLRRTRVVFFSEILDKDHDGAVRTMYQLISRINAERYEFLFICGTGPDELYGFECLKVPAFTVPVNKSYKLALPALVQNSLKEKLRTFDADVVHISTPSLLGEFALKYARQEQLPVITIYHTHFISYIDYYFKHTPFLIDFIRSRVIESQRNFYNGCDMIYMPSEGISRWLGDIGVNAGKMKSWKRGIDTRLFSPAKNDAELMRNMTGNNAPVILFASRLVWEKNLETLFDIYDGLKATSIPFNIIIAGDGKEKSVCEERMPDAFFTGRVDHETLSALYASADVFVFPSVSEAYGNVVLEAMASGLPCVIADGGGSADFMQQGINGFKCSPYDAGEYINKIMLLLNDDNLRWNIIQAGLSYSSTFDWDELADVYFNDLNQLAKQNHGQLLPAE